MYLPAQSVHIIKVLNKQQHNFLGIDDVSQIDTVQGWPTQGHFCFAFLGFESLCPDTEALPLPSWNPCFFFLKKKKNLAVLGRCWAQAFSRCDEWGSLSSGGTWASHCGGFSCGSWALGQGASVTVAHGLSCPAACVIFPHQRSNLYSCIGSKIPGTTRAVHVFFELCFLRSSLFYLQTKFKLFLVTEQISLLPIGFFFISVRWRKNTQSLKSLHFLHAQLCGPHKARKPQFFNFILLTLLFGLFCSWFLVFSLSFYDHVWAMPLFSLSCYSFSVSVS